MWLVRFGIKIQKFCAESSSETSLGDKLVYIFENVSHWSSNSNVNRKKPSEYFTNVCWNWKLLKVILAHMVCFGSRHAAQWKKKSLHLIFCKVNCNGFSYHFPYPTTHGLRIKKCNSDIPTKPAIKTVHINS